MASVSTSLGFTAGGIDASSIVSSLMQVERQPLTILQNRQAAARVQVTAMAALKTNLDAIKSSAAGILTSGLAKMSVSSSSANATATISGSARQGSLTFTVDRLAQAAGFRTASTVSSSAAVVTSEASLAVSSTATRLGIGAIHVGTGVPRGDLTVSVTKATAGATAAGTAALGASNLIDGTNNTLDLTIDGVARSITVAGGTYTTTGLVSAVQAAIDAGGGGAKAALGASGRIEITTTHEGSSATLAVTGGSALGVLSLAASSSVGVDGVIKVGTNPPTAVTSAGPGQSVVVSAGAGDLTMQLSSGLRLGDSKVAVVSTGDRSLAAVSAAINAANAGVSAAAIQTAPGAWLLQVNSLRSGTDNGVVLDASAFSSVGGLLQTTAAQDAKITIGSGPGAYSVVSSSNSFAEMMPGVSLTVNAVSPSPTTPTTIIVGRDDTATADAVQKLVDQANALLTEITKQTKFNASTKTVAPLASNSIVRSLADDTRAAITSLVGGTTPNNATALGINVQRDGSIKFDRATFLSAMAANPDGVEAMFGRHGTSAGGATWAASSAETEGGSYAVNVTAPASRATTGVVLSGGSVGGQVVGVRIGSTTVSYSATAGESAASIAAGLNVELAKGGLAVTAEASAGGLTLTSISYGAAQSFESNLDVSGAGSWSASTGTDVAGTINGEAAIGIGNRLRLLNLGTSPARGLEVVVDEGVTGTLPPINYQPGIAARLTTLATKLTATTGVFTSSANSYDAKVTSFNAQIDKFEARMTKVEANYRRQWSTIQTMLSSLQNQGDWLASQISGLSASTK